MNNGFIYILSKIPNEFNYDIYINCFTNSNNVYSLEVLWKTDEKNVTNEKCKLICAIIENFICSKVSYSFYKVITGSIYIFLTSEIDVTYKLSSCSKHYAYNLKIISNNIIETISTIYISNFFYNNHVYGILAGYKIIKYDDFMLAKNFYFKTVYLKELNVCTL